jgi:hypothetical protein
VIADRKEKLIAERKKMAQNTIFQRAIMEKDELAVRLIVLVTV